MIIFILPKNSGLAVCRKFAKSICSENSRIIEVRGEDVAFFTEELLKKGKKAIGITGEDLFQEYLLGNKKTSLRIKQKRKWPTFSPKLCLLGPKEKNFSKIPKKIKICINNKYKNLSENYIKILEKKGYVFERIYLSGSTEETFTNDISEFIIDIVFSGKSAKEAGLKIYSKIFEGGIVIIGKNEKEIQ